MKTASELNKWAFEQRKAYFKGLLSPYKIKQLEMMPNWTWQLPITEHEAKKYKHLWKDKLGNPISMSKWLKENCLVLTKDVEEVSKAQKLMSRQRREQLESS